MNPYCDLLLLLQHDDVMDILNNFCIVILACSRCPKPVLVVIITQQNYIEIQDVSDSAMIRIVFPPSTASYGNDIVCFVCIFSFALSSTRYNKLPAFRLIERTSPQFCCISTTYRYIGLGQMTNVAQSHISRTQLKYVSVGL